MLANMSMKRAATVSAWQRDEHGNYAAELHGFSLKVLWKPNTRRERGSFTWRAERDDVKHVSEEHYEEMEEAMAEAEACAEGEERKAAAAKALAEKAGAASDHD